MFVCDGINNASYEEFLFWPRSMAKMVSFFHSSDRTVYGLLLPLNPHPEKEDQDKAGGEQQQECHGSALCILQLPFSTTRFPELEVISCVKSIQSACFYRKK
jgi:hypothetical protein